ncbi:YIP1 family protein [Roseovarius gahaiensis]|uniref:YIP1 family protein n=1 Tax=Roseovarius gahaiensis TaxID=2716691 RepID=A0A967EGJ7_9RHOB|nr:YIP1 family protein [Roseovarius gahaiensis]NHQ74720.1 YIP1 family protein [Roseovarius gahaiensis]
MPVTTDIAATYKGPRAVFRRLLAMDQNEGRALALVMAACVVVFVGQWPRLAREAHLNEQELNPLLGGALLGWVFIMPLVLYALAFVSHLLQRGFGGQGDGYTSRLALFWAFLAASPLMLLNGLIAGFVGPGPGLKLVGVIWIVIFLWFWLSNLREAGWGTS